MFVPVINISNNELPLYANEGDAGMDLRADLSNGINPKFLFNSQVLTLEGKNKVIINPMGRALIPTGLSTVLPEGYEAQIRPRSGLALKNGITVLNTPGTIDMGYRNVWGVILINLGTEPFVVEDGDRIAQAVLNKFEKIEWQHVEVLPESQRGLTGFGDSGIK